MKKHMKTNLAYNPWFYSISSTLLIFVLGVLIITAQSIHSYDENLIQRLNLAVNVIDRKLNDKKVVFSDIHELLDQPCERQNLVDIKMLYNQFQTINIVKDNNVTCSNNPRMVNHSPVYDVSNGILHITISKVIHPGDIVFYINDLYKGSGVLATFSAQDIYSSLEYISDKHQHFRIKADNIEIDKNGQVYDKKDTKNTHEIRSKEYGYTIKETTKYNYYLNNLLEHYLGIIIFFALISVAIGKYIHSSAVKNSSLSFMKNAIKKNEFVPFAQPIMDTSGNLTGCEILMRWKNKHIGFIYPDQFIPLAEESGLIIPMTKQLLSSSYDVFKSCEETIPNGFHIGFNISAQHFDPKNQNDLIESCKLFSEDSLAGKVHLTLELTERNSIENYDDTQLVFDALHKMNVKMAVDDFGTGHSTLTYIQKLSFDFIKIDKSFIDFIGTDAISAPLVDNIIDLSQRLNLSIVAEGVETQEQLDYLKSKNVDLIQGYYYSRPIPLEEFIEKYFS